MSQHSDIARSAIMSCASPFEPPREHHLAPPNGIPNGGKDANLMPPKTVVGRALGNELHPDAHKPLSAQPSRDGVGFALTDTPISTAPSSPQMYVAPPLPRSCFSRWPWSTAPLPPLVRGWRLPACRDRWPACRARLCAYNSLLLTCFAQICSRAHLRLCHPQQGPSDHPRHPWPHQVQGFTRRSDRAARCWVQARHHHGRPPRTGQELHHQEDGPLPELAAARHQDLQRR